MRAKLMRNMVFLAFAVGFVSLVPLGSVQADSEKIEQTRTTLEKWVETQRIISEEKRDFKLAKEMLNERIDLVKREIESLEEKIGQAEDSIAEADKKRMELIEENDKLKAASASLVDTMVALEKRIKELLVRLPDPIRDRVKPLSQRLPDGKTETKLNNSERFQNMVGILNEVDKFNREITATSELRDLENGSSMEVAAMYIGIGQAYYVNNNGDVAGIGTSGDEGWIWSPNNDVASQISLSLGIFNNEKPASFVPLPVEIR